MVQTSSKKPFGGLRFSSKRDFWIILDRAILRQAERERRLRRMKSYRLRQLARLRALGYMKY